MRVRCEFRANESDATRVEKSREKMVAEKVNEAVKKSAPSSNGNMTISGSMDKLVEMEEKRPQYRVNKISEAVVGANEGWY